MGISQLEQIFQRDDVPSDVKELIIGLLDEIKGDEEALQESEKRLRDFMESSTDIIQLFDSNLNYISVNKAAEKLFNLSREEIIGKSYLDFFPYLKGTDRLNVYKDVIKTGKPFVREGSVPKFGDKIFLIRAFKVGYGLGMIISDVTELKKTEEALIGSKQALLDSNKRLLEVQHLAKVGFLDWNLKTDRILLSDEVINLYGLDPAKKWFTPDFVAQVVHQDDMNYVQSNLEMALKGIKKYNIDHRVVRPDGTVLWVHTQAELVRDEEGNPQNLLGTIVDITERKKMEEALRESEERLRGFIDSATDPIEIWDSKFNLVECNQAVIDEFPEATKEEDLIGRNILDLIPNLKETGRYDKYLEVIRTGNSLFLDSFRSHPKFGDKYYSVKVFKVGNGLGMINRDITDRKNAEKALKESEERLRSFMEASPDNFLLFNQDFNLIEVNKATIASYPSVNKREEILGKNLLDLSPDIKETGRYEQYQKVLRTGEPINVEEFIPHPKFGKIIISLKAFKVGKGLGLIATDITERERAEENLRRSEIRYRKLFEESPVSLWEEDFSQVFSYLASLKESGIKDFRKYFTEHPEDVAKCASLAKILDVNQATIDLYKAKNKGELIENLNRVFVEESYDCFREELVALAEGATKFSIEVINQNLKGEKIYADLGLSISTGYDDPTSRVLISILDVTKRKQAEEALRESEIKYRSLVERANDGITIVSDYKLVFINPQFAQMLGYTVEEIINTPYKRITHPEATSDINNRYQSRITGESAPSIYETKLMKKNGVPIDVEFNVGVITYQGKLATLTFVRDITERKKMDRARQDLDNRRSAFVSMTSHELRTPITVIKGYSEFLDKNIENLDTIRKAQAIQSISRNVLRLERLIEGVADITRMDQGIFRLKTTIIDFSKFLKESTRPYKELHGNKFSIQGTLEFDSPIFLNIDIDRIRQVLDNLMDNANKNTPEDGTITLTPTVLSNTIQMAISDTGAGIDSNDLERIFEQFVSITTERASGGTGIGLYVSRVICESHGGTLTAHSEGKNQGATFIIELPRWFE